MLKEFKEFISRGNVLDMAIGVIIGGAFGKIVTSVVNDLLMPLLGIVMGGLDFSNLSLKIGKSKILYGSFIQNVVDFLIIATCIFLIMKIFNKITHKEKKEQKKTTDVSTKSDDIRLLEEIRDLLKEKNKTAD